MCRTWGFIVLMHGCITLSDATLYDKNFNEVFVLEIDKNGQILALDWLFFFLFFFFFFHWSVG